jgi:hypothetical protein
MRASQVAGETAEAAVAWAGVRCANLAAAR